MHLHLLGSLHVDGIMTAAEREVVVDSLFAVQKRDGGWGVVSLGNWKRHDGKEDDQECSDGLGTGFAISGSVCRQAARRRDLNVARSIGGAGVFTMQDKVAIVTGAGSGIGRAIAEALSAEGSERRSCRDRCCEGVHRRRGDPLQNGIATARGLTA